MAILYKKKKKSSQICYEFKPFRVNIAIIRPSVQIAELYLNHLSKQSIVVSLYYMIQLIPYWFYTNIILGLLFKAQQIHNLKNKFTCKLKISCFSHPYLV